MKLYYLKWRNSMVSVRYILQLSFLWGWSGWAKPCTGTDPRTSRLNMSPVGLDGPGIIMPGCKTQPFCKVLRDFFESLSCDKCFRVGVTTASIHVQFDTDKSIPAELFYSMLICTYVYVNVCTRNSLDGPLDYAPQTQRTNSIGLKKFKNNTFLKLKISSFIWQCI